MGDMVLWYYNYRSYTRYIRYNYDTIHNYYLNDIYGMYEIILGFTERMKRSNTPHHAIKIKFEFLRNIESYTQ